ncbi:MAG: hypothetical protein AUK47_08970 [Deltaproteobacteria bacterium CG2_30_63_29]|nr:MAG: hypothetical protein AUK47_08970 [Deltaproteobacteria bacterium CG2_30_63_29]
MNIGFSRSLRLTLLFASLWALTSLATVSCGDDAKPQVIPDQSEEIDVAEEVDQTPEVDVAPEVDVDICAGNHKCLDDFGRPKTSMCVGEQVCNAGTGCCEEPFRCTSDSECEATRSSHRDCPDPTLACLCNQQTGACYPFICSGDADCDTGLVCADGQCVELPATSGLQAHIVTPGGPLLVGDDLQLEVVAVEPSNPAVVVRANVTFTFASSNDAYATVGATGSLAPLSAGEVTITAKVAANAADPGDTVVFLIAPAATEPLRVTVVDQHTTLPVADGFMVYVTDTNGVSTSAATTGGTATFGPTVDFPVSVSIYDEGYTYMTLLAVAPKSGESRVDVFIPATPITSAVVVQNAEQTEFLYTLNNVGAVYGKPDFSAVQQTGEIEVSLSGLSLTSSLFELDLDLIIGPPIEQYLPSPIDQVAEIPSGITLAFNGPIASTFVAVGEPPLRTLWTVGGRVSLFDNPTLIQDIVGQVSSNDLGDIVAAILPFFRDFSSGVVIGMPIVDGAVTEQNTVLKVPTNIETTLPIQGLVRTSTSVQDLALVIGGAVMPGQGLLPLGLTAGVAHKDLNGEYTGTYDGDPTTADVSDPIVLSMAPLHSGLEAGSRYAVVMAALSPNGGGNHTSGVVARLGAGSSVPALLPMPRTELPPLPEGSTYDEATRTVRVTLGAGESPAVVRVILAGHDGGSWVVYAPGNMSSIVLPDPANLASVYDRADNDVNLSTLSFADPAIDYSNLIDFNGRRLDSLIETVSEFTVFQLR